jgi:predicted nucleic acid-binding protein
MELLDTDVLIDVQRRHPPAIAWFSSLTMFPVVPGIVAMELIQNTRNTQDLRTTLLQIAPLTVIWPNEAEGQSAFQLFATYHLSHSLGLLDSFIAAIALSRKYELLTFNLKHFRMIPGLTLRNPYVR